MERYFFSPDPGDVPYTVTLMCPVLTNPLPNRGDFIYTVADDKVVAWMVTDLKIAPDSQRECYFAEKWIPGAKESGPWDFFLEGDFYRSKDEAENSIFTDETDEVELDLIV